MNHAVETKTGLNERRSREKNRPGKVSLNREPASSGSQYGLQKIGTILNSEIERGSENASNKSDDQALAKARVARAGSLALGPPRLGAHDHPDNHHGPGPTSHQPDEAVSDGQRRERDDRQQKARRAVPEQEHVEERQQRHRGDHE